MWTCPKCQSKVDPLFEVCWNCGTTADGVEDPTFVKADDAEPMEAEPLFASLVTPDKAQLVGELPEPIRGDLVEAYGALDLMEANFLVDQLNQAGIQAVSDTHDFHEILGTMEGAPKVWVSADDLPRARAWLEAYDRDKVAPAGD